MRLTDIHRDDRNIDTTFINTLENIDMLKAFSLLDVEHGFDIDSEFGQGCYDDTFSQLAKAKLLNQFYLNSKIFRDLLASLSIGEESLDDLLRRLNNVHGLNATA